MIDDVNCGIPLLFFSVLSCLPSCLLTMWFLSTHSFTDSCFLTYVRSFIKQKINLFIHASIHLYYTSHHSALLFFFSLICYRLIPFHCFVLFSIVFFSPFVLYTLVLSCFVLSCSSSLLYIRHVCTHSSSPSSQFTIFIFNTPPPTVTHTHTHTHTLPFPCFFLTSNHMSSHHFIGFQ